MPGPNHIAHAIRHELQGDPYTDDAHQWGTVHAVNTGTVKSVDLLLDGSSNVTPGVRYHGSYAPAVGDIVLVARIRSGNLNMGSDRVVLGKLA